LPLVAILAAGVGCFDTDKGPAPPSQQFYFPTGLAVSPGGKALFIANSDFDLQFRAGTIQALDLERLRRLIPPLKPPPDAEGKTSGRADCAAAGLAPLDSGGALLFPGPCVAIDVNSPPDQQGTLVRGTVDIGAFASDLLLVRRPAAAGSSKATEARLLVPVRGDPSITWLDIDDDSEGAQGFRIQCGQGDGRRCADDHRAGIDPAANLRNLTLPSEPFEIAVNDRTDAVVVSHQTSGSLSLLLNGWAESVAPCTKGPAGRPQLSFVLGGLPTGATGLVSLPMPRLVQEKEARKGECVAACGSDATCAAGCTIPYAPAFLVSYRNAAQVDLVRYYDDCASSPARPFLAVTGRSGINTNAGGYDSRSVAIDAGKRRACEAACAATDDACLAGCAGVPVDVFVANRAPPSLLVGRAVGSVSQYGTDDSVSFGQTLPLAQGASRVELGHIIDAKGVVKPRVFILCFDARLLYVYDPEAAVIEAVVTTGRGPSTIVFDPGIQKAAGGDKGAGAYAYLAHFTDSYLAVLDLDMRHSATYLTFLASVGVPASPREQ